MITLRQIHEFIFSSFRISDMDRLLDELEQEKIEQIIIVKRSWIYGAFINLILFLVLMLVGMNIYLMLINTTAPFIFLSIIMGLMTLTIIFMIFSGLVYIQRFHTLYKKKSILTGIQNVRYIKKIVREEEANFAKFFNQMSANYYIFVCITIVHLYYIFVYMDSNIFTLLEAFLLTMQIILLSYYQKHMIDLELDYVIVIPSRLYFIDQVGMHKRTQSIKWVTDIRLITSSYPNFFGSFFNYGTIEIIVRSDTPAIVMNYHMRYVDNPIGRVDQINQLINKKSEIR